MNNSTRKKMLIASLPLLLIITALVAGFIFFPESFDLRNKASTGTTTITPRPTGTEAMLTLQESADRDNVVQSFDVFLNTTYKPDAVVSSFKTTILLSSQNGMVLAEQTTATNETEQVNALEAPRTISTSVCYSNVGQDNKGQFVWYGCKNPNVACIAAITPLTESEIQGYKAWVEAGKTPVAGCGAATTPIITQNPTACAPAPSCPNGNLVTGYSPETKCPVYKCESTNIDEVVVFQENFLKVTTLAKIQSLFDLSVTSNKINNGMTYEIVLTGTLKPGVSTLEVQKQNLKVATVKYDTQRFTRTVSGKIQQRSVMGTTATSAVPVELITSPTITQKTVTTPTSYQATTTPSSCGAKCSTNSACSNGLACINGLCKNPACTGSSSCLCGPTNTPPTGGTGDCVIAGCSGELCVDASARGMASTCQYNPEYSCLKRTTCSRNSQGVCQWDRTSLEYNQCINSLPKTTITLNPPSVSPTRIATKTPTPTTPTSTPSPAVCPPAPFCDGNLVTGYSPETKCPVYKCEPVITATPTPIPSPVTCPWYNPFCSRVTPTSSPTQPVITATPVVDTNLTPGAAIQVESAVPTPFDQVVVPPTPTVTCQWWNIACRARSTRRPTPTPTRPPVTPRVTLPTTDSVGCSALYSPVCTTTNRTFSNACEAQKAGAIITYTGVCIR